jgi:hypothetical protein
LREDLDGLWWETLQRVIDVAAHEVKDALNGVSVNLEVIRSRSGRRPSNPTSVVDFAEAASGQFEALSERVEAVLFLSRPHKPAGAPVDVSLTLRHLGSLLAPAAKANGGSLGVEGSDKAATTSAPAAATRLALATPLLSLIKEGGRGRCQLEPGQETVVRFSHESAGTCSLDPAVAEALAEYEIQNKRSGSDLLLIFPGLG